MPTTVLTVIVTQEGNTIATSINGTVDPHTAAGYLLRAMLEIITQKPIPPLAGEHRVFPQLRPKKF